MGQLGRFVMMIAVILLTFSSTLRADVLDDLVNRAPNSWAAVKIGEARAGNPDAQYVVGRGLVDGSWVGLETKMGLEWLRRAADNGQPNASFTLARLYELGQYGIPIDIDQAEYWYERSFNAGMSYAARKLALLNESKSPPDIEKALSWSRKGAEAGDFECQLELGGFYGSGFRLRLDYSQSLYWYLRAMAHDVASSSQYADRAQAVLGAYYENGLGTARSMTDALQWYRVAARNGNTDANYALGKIYESGEGVAPNQDEAMDYFVAAAERDHQLAQYRLGLGFANGTGVAADRVQAIKWLTLASRRCCELTKGEVEQLRLHRVESLLSWRVEPRDVQNTLEDSMKVARAELNRIKHLSTADEIKAGETQARDFNPVRPPLPIP